MQENLLSTSERVKGRRDLLNRDLLCETPIHDCWRQDHKLKDLVSPRQFPRFMLFLIERNQGRLIALRYFLLDPEHVHRPRVRLNIGAIFLLCFLNHFTFLSSRLQIVKARQQNV